MRSMATCTGKPNVAGSARSDESVLEDTTDRRRAAIDSTSMRRSNAICQGEPQRSCRSSMSTRHPSMAA